MGNYRERGGITNNVETKVWIGTSFSTWIVGHVNRVELTLITTPRGGSHSLINLKSGIILTRLKDTDVREYVTHNIVCGAIGRLNNRLANSAVNFLEPEEAIALRNKVEMEVKLWRNGKEIPQFIEEEEEEDKGVINE